MRVQEQEICNLVKDLPSDAYNKIIDYITYIRYTLNLNDKKTLEN